MPATRSHLVRLIASTTLITALAVTAACRKQEPPPTDPVVSSSDHLRTAKLVSHVTDGTVPRDVRITVRFVDEHDDRQTDARTLARAFSCNPMVTGSAEWVDPRTITLSPQTPLIPGAEYRCALDMAAVLPGQDSAKPFAFSFQVAPNQVTAWQSELEPAASDDPERLVYTGWIEFADATTIEEIRRNVVLTDGRQKVKLEWRVEPDDRRFWFASEVLERGSKARTINLEIPAEPFGIEAPIRRSVEIRPLGDLGVVDVEIQNQEAEPRLAIRFSDPLEEGTDLSGYVRVEPHLDLRISVMGSALMVTGPFRREVDYTLVIRRGIPSRWDTAMDDDYSQTLRFTDLDPQLNFSQTGALLPSSSRGTIAFRTVNVRQVTATVTRVFESNLGQFLQNDGLTAGRDLRWMNGQLNRVGVEVASTKLDIGEHRNRWIQSSLDLSPLLEGHERGLYVISLAFDRDQMLIECDAERRYPYYEHPCGYGFASNRGRVIRPVLVTDIGLIAKRTVDRTIVAVTHLETTEPLADVDVALYSFQNQVIARGRTDATGVVELVTPEDGFYLEGRWGGQRTALKFADSLLTTSGFEVSGSVGSSAPTRAFVYTDRGVYRPGDTIHLAAVVRNTDGSFPDDHPLSLKIRNPKNQVVHTELDRHGLAGHYAFRYTTEDTDPTGRWIAEIVRGETTIASHPLRVEMVAPNRLKVRLDTPTPAIGDDRTAVEVGIDSSYLFGAPAAALRSTLEVDYRSVEKSFDAYPDYVFTHPAKFMAARRDQLFDDTLDADGHAVVEWRIPELTDIPSALRATLTARVFEKGGRPTTEATVVAVDPYDAYVGLRRPAERWAKIGKETPLTVVLVDPDGTPISGRDLEVSVYTNERSWWWEYRSFDDYRRRFRSDVRTRLVDRTVVTSAARPVAVSITPTQHGQALIEVRDPEGGHAAGTFLWVSSWGRSHGPIEAGTQLEMEVDRERYHPGDTARVTIKTPSEGVAFVSVEKADRVLSHDWHPLTSDTTTIEVPVTEEMLPNAYLHVTAVQPHAQTANDRPIRLYGVVPLAVEDPDTRLPVSITAPEVLKPLQPFSIEVDVPDGRETTLTVAVVDEGLLDLTSFGTPDPWAFFFAKEQLAVRSFDVFASVIGAIWGNIDRRFAVGGDEDAYRKGQAGPVKARRFPPVALFAEPVRTDGNGKARFEFEMPNYMGSVRIMAVAASGASYGHAEATVPVREALIVLPSLPRVAGPGEVFDMPVTIFATEDDVGEVQVAVTTDGPLTVVGPGQAVVDFDGIGEQDLVFTLTAETASGVARVRVDASAEAAKTHAATELAVRPVNPIISSSKEMAIAAGETVAFTIPELGMPGTRAATVRISPIPGINFGHRLDSLIRYPYGCLEQTMSAVFPQLYLKPILAESGTVTGTTNNLIDHHINAGIQRMQRFRMPDGGFGYWPGSSQRNEWATNYAGHFLVEARRRGYHVPDDMLAAWRSFQKQRAAEGSGDILTRSYRLYLLALVGEPQIGAMNLLVEEHRAKMNDLSCWLLAAAYHLAGMEDASSRILASAGTEVPSYRERGGTFGSTIRDRAMMLHLAQVLERPQIALELYHELLPALGGRGFLSTHEAGYALLAVGGYLEHMLSDEVLVRGRLSVAGGAFEKSFDRRGGTVSIDVGGHTGRETTVRSTSEDPFFAVFEWQGIPIEGPTETESRNLTLSTRWLDEDGLPLDPTRIAQGSVFWCHIRVGNSLGSRIENIALTQIVPSGWEIDATRLRGEQTPPWANRFTLGRETYLDVRDDRVMWFFDLTNQPMDFLVKLVAVTRGEFVLAPTWAEAMYDNDCRALAPGGPVEVVEPESP